MFKLKSSYQPAGDQELAIKSLVSNIKDQVSQQVLLGVTGSGKTFTIANVIEKIQKPTLVISHNKTLAAQLYQEFKEYFPENAISYFVSYYDYYQPEAYIPASDTYIEKSTAINEEIDKLRLQTTTNLLTRKDTIVIASVSCIYNLGSPDEYGRTILELAEGLKISRDQIFMRLNDLQYLRSDFNFKRGSFRVRGENIDIYPAYEDIGIRVTHDNQKIIKLSKFHTVSGEPLPRTPLLSLGEGNQRGEVIFPAKHFVASKENQNQVINQIIHDMEIQEAKLKSENRLLEANRIRQRVIYDMEMIKEVGYVNGIENYSRYFDGRSPGDPPYSLLEYFNKSTINGKMTNDKWSNITNDYLLVIDESHITVPQIRGMYNGDRIRKQTLIDFGFRLPSALDNRPLKFDEFQRRMGTTVYLSATPDEWEISQSKNTVVEQLIRPTGLIDPQITVLPTKNQITHLVSEIWRLVSIKQRTLVTTLTKRMAEDLSSYLEEQGIKVHYLHADIDTLERLDILNDLREGKYDVLVGINLLREGLDLPEVSLVAILDADKEGFLRSRTSLIQVMGRAARHQEGKVIMYADTVTKSMQAAIEEVSRRRHIQLDYNQKHHITPQSIIKPLRDRIVEKVLEDPIKLDPKQILKKHGDPASLDMSKVNQLTPEDRTKLVKLMRREMLKAAHDLNFELAALLRDKISSIVSS